MRGGRPFLIPSKAYERFKREAHEQIHKQVSWDPFPFNNVPPDGLFDICCTFYQKGKLTQDGDNALSSILDVLQDSGILNDDKYVISASYNIVRGEKEWKTEVEITRLDEESLTV